MTSAKMLPGPLPEPIAETSMPNQSTDGELDAEPVPSGNVGERAEDLGRICLALMSRLEASLAGSRRALLALDLGGIERGTREQIGWVREFETLLERYRLAPLSREALAGAGSELSLSSGCKRLYWPGVGQNCGCWRICWPAQAPTTGSCCGRTACFAAILAPGEVETCDSCQA